MTSTWKNQQTGKQGGTKQAWHTRVNYYHLFLWVHINNAAHKLNWSPAAMEQKLALDHPKLFWNINCGTIHKWINSDSKQKWSECTKGNVAWHHTLAGSGQVGISAKHSDVVKEIVAKLHGLWKSGLTVNVTISHSIMLAIIEKCVPNLLKIFKCSEVSQVLFNIVNWYWLTLFQRYVWAFVQSKLNWKPWKGTCAAAHLPANVEDQCEAAFFQLVYAMKWENVPPKVSTILLTIRQFDLWPIIICTCSLLLVWTKLGTIFYQTTAQHFTITVLNKLM